MCNSTASNGHALLASILESYATLPGRVARLREPVCHYMRDRDLHCACGARIEMTDADTASKYARDVTCRACIESMPWPGEAA